VHVINAIHLHLDQNIKEKPEDFQTISGGIYVYMHIRVCVKINLSKHLFRL